MASSVAPDAPGRIAVMSDELADQIAAGEVVERPAAVVKELVENAIDAGATRVEVELEGGGMKAIRVIDDGGGIDPEDLPLAIRRHATSKLRRAEDLVEIATHGFRGEALASIAAVARLRLRSRRGDAGVGQELRSSPGEPVERGPVGMPVGTQIEVAHLFASVPARRKFMRSEATEVGHCNEAVLRSALVHPTVHFALRHEGRQLLDFPPATPAARVEAVLGRRGQGPVTVVEGTRGGIAVRGHFVDPSAASRSRHGVFLVVRNRVVKERSLLRIVRQAYGDALAEGSHPVACLFVEPPPGTVDVNVHPQKTEVRFSDPQTVYATVRELLREGLARAPWFADAAQPDAGGAVAASAREALSGWAARPIDAGAASGAGAYRLGTRATGGAYQADKQALKREVDVLRSRLPQNAGGGGPRFGPGPNPGSNPGPNPGSNPGPNPGRDADAEPSTDAGPSLLACLPGHVALFLDGDGVLAVDLIELRAQLVYRRLARDLGGEGVAAQGLLTPVVVKVAPADVEACRDGGAILAGIGVDLEPFGDDAVAVRAVPAQLRNCVDDADVGDLVVRVLPWLRLRRRDGGQTDGAEDRHAVLAAIAGTRGADPAPRLARRWVRELYEAGELDQVPGVRRWAATELVDRAQDRGGERDDG